MKNQWMAYVIVALLAIGAGVAIAGLPDTAPVEATIVSPTTAAASGTTVEPETTEPPETTEAVSDTTVEPETTEATETTEADSDTTTTTAPETTAGLPERSEIAVGVANGSGVAGAAARNVALLADVGYVDLAGLDGTEIVEFTTIYFADGFDEAADRLALDLDLLPIFVAPIADAPPVINLADDIELLAYIGTDRA